MDSPKRINKMKINDFIKKLEQEAQKTTEKLYTIKSLERLKEVAKLYEGEDRMISSQDIAEKIKSEPKVEKIMSGFPSLDKIIGGFSKEQVIVVSALTKSGKTQMCINLTDNMKEHNPTWFPFEESAREIVSKFLERGDYVPNFYTPEAMKGNSVEWIETRIIESIAKYDTKVVFIDQLDFIVPLTGDNRADRIGEVMRNLKGLAKKWGIVIFLICHLSKSSMNEQPTLESLKGSSSIGQEADTVILLWRESKKENGQIVITNNVNVSVQANRREGRTGNVKMIFNEGRFTEFEWIDGYEEERRVDASFSNDF